MTNVSSGDRRTRGERGAAMVLGAMIFTFLALPLCALGVDTARWWVEAQRLQAAADAAATSGVTYMPDDFAKAKARAIEFANSNGYTAGSGTTITVTGGEKPTQLKVTISQTVDNFFARSFGVDTSTITRLAVADFNGPAPMGSPCNSRCTNEPDNSPGSLTIPSWGNVWNDFATDASQRYWRTGTTWGGYLITSKPNDFCTGDDPNTNLYSGSENAGVTSFALRQPVDTLVPWQGAPVSGCARQYVGRVASEVSLQTLRKGDVRYDADLTRLFHQWVNLCTFTPTQPGDYYLQVRNNVSSGSTSDGQGGFVANPDVYTQLGDDTSVRGTGTNNFGLRAISNAAVGAISIAAHEKMRIFANSDSASTSFNLVRVVPAAANKTLVVSFFDVGEGASSGSVKILKPTDSVNLPSSLAGCTGSGVRNGALTNCEITGITPSGFNGKYQEIRVPIPSAYSCQVASQGGCWFRVQVSFGSGQVTDATTWTARIEGEPIRLIE